MSDDEVERAIRDAEQYAAQDGLRRDFMAARDEAQSLLSEADRALAQVGKQLEKDEKKQIKADAAALRKLVGKKLDALSAADVDELRSAKDRLERSSARARTLVSRD